MLARLLLLACLLTVVSGCSPGLLRSPERIEASLLRLTPLGSSPEAVLEVAQREGWKHVRSVPNAGFSKQAYPKSETIGVSSIRASLGDYTSGPLMTTNATAYWGFDKERRLIAIWVWKTIDGP